jgi:diguanylate cyclase (GGDEF)-like protein
MAAAINESNDNLLRNIEEKNFLAYYNTMTKIPNRNSLSSELTKYFDQMRIDELAIIYVDIDKFRNINELLGYSQGNIFIKRVANILSDYESKDIKLFHTNVDEFVYLIRNHDKDEEISRFTRSILNNFGRNFSFGFHSFYVTVSIGVAR